MIIDIRYIIVLYCIVWFDQKKWFIHLLQQQMTSGRMPYDVDNWQRRQLSFEMLYDMSYNGTMHSLISIMNAGAKYLMHHVLLCIKKLMVHLFEFLQCAFLFTMNRPHSYNASYCIA
jgi:hypothetical protein